MDVRDQSQKEHAPSDAERFSEDYHEYVFQEGKLVGDFDSMYRHAKGVPWSQDIHCDRWYTEVGFLILGDQAPFSSILEVGCGLGFLTAKLQNLLNPDGILDAFDISPEAIRKASERQPGIGFYVDDIRQRQFTPRRIYDLVVVKEIFWYVTDHLQVVLENLRACVKPKGLLYIGQSFPLLENPFVGKDVISSPDVLTGYFKDFESVCTAIVRHHPFVNDGPILHFLCRKSS